MSKFRKRASLKPELARRYNGEEFALPLPIEEKVIELFGFCSSMTHQVRCHKYLDERSILRDANTPATLAAVRDLAGRAYNMGRSDMANELKAKQSGEEGERL